MLWQLFFYLPLYFLLCLNHSNIYYFKYDNRKKANHRFNTRALQPTSKHGKAGKAFEGEPFSQVIGSGGKA